MSRFNPPKQGIEFPVAMSHSEMIMKLISQNIPSVKAIYQGGTMRFSERMHLWDLIEKIEWINRSQDPSEEAIRSCYQGFIQDLTKFINQETSAMMKMNLEGLIGALQTSPLKDNPRQFVTEMADMISEENKSINNYYLNESRGFPDIDLLQITSSDKNDSMMESLTDQLEALMIQLVACCDQETKIMTITEVHGEAGRKNFEKMTARCHEMSEVCCQYFEEFFVLLKNVIDYLKNAKRIFQKKLAHESLNLPLPDNAMTLEALDNNFALLTSALCSINEGLENYQRNLAHLYTTCQTSVSSTLFNSLQGYKARLAAFLRGYLQMSVVTIKCPLTIYQTKASAASAKREEDAAAKDEPLKAKRRTPAKTKDYKENSGLNSTLKILGASSFNGKLRILPSKCSVVCINESSLTEDIKEGESFQLDEKEIPHGKLMPDNHPVLRNSFELTFYRQEMAEISRKMGGGGESVSDKNSTSFVCANFFRLYYRIGIELFDNAQILHVVSHPIGWKTGSAQLHPYHGSLIWYHWNVGNVYEKFRIPQSLKLSTVLDMLDAIISDIKDNTATESQRTKSRSLSSNERKFLGKLLLGDESTEEYVSLRDFICVPIEDKKRTHSSNKKKRILNVDFHTWWQALCNSLNGFMNHLWLDCLIYEICSGDDTAVILRRPETEMGTIMFRPSLTRVQRLKGKDVVLDLIIDFNTNVGDNDLGTVFWKEENIKHLPEAVMNLNLAFKAIQGINNRRWHVSILKDYFSNTNECLYRGNRFKMKMSFELVSNSDGNSECETGEKKTKVSSEDRRDSSSMTGSSFCYEHAPTQPSFKQDPHENLSPSSQQMGGPQEMTLSQLNTGSIMPDSSLQVLDLVVEHLREQGDVILGEDYLSIGVVHLG